MTKHTLKDFLDGSICVRCDTSEDKQRLLQICTEAGITEAYSSLLDIQQIVLLHNVFYIDRQESILACISEATSKFCNAIPFSSLANDTSSRRIVIDYSDTITTATLYNGEKAVRSATINRCHNDNPSVHTASVEAIDKLLAKQPKQPKPKKPAEKNSFKVGDRVVIDDPRSGTGRTAHGKHGTIMSLENEDYVENVFAVELDEPVYGHDCIGQTKPGHGCYASAENLRHEQTTKPQMREVTRRAKVGEWVKIVEADHGHGEKYKTGDVLRVVHVDPVGCVSLSCGGFVASSREYVVLEGYQPEEPANA